MKNRVLWLDGRKKGDKNAKNYVIEDDLKICAELSKLLQNNGYQVCFQTVYRIRALSL